MLKRMSKKGKDSDTNLTLGMIIDSLTPGQAWSFGGALAVLLALSFTFGYRWDTRLNEAKLAEASVTIAKQTKEIEEYKIKEKSYTLTDRRIVELQAQADAVKNPNSETIERAKASARLTAGLVKDQIEKGDLVVTILPSGDTELRDRGGHPIVISELSRAELRSKGIFNHPTNMFLAVRLENTDFAPKTESKPTKTEIKPTKAELRYISCLQGAMGDPVTEAVCSDELQDARAAEDASQN